MIRAARRRLRSIRYHAASRPDSAWYRWRDRLLIAAIPLSIPAMLTLESLVHRATVAAEVRGGIVGPVGGPYEIGLALGDEADVEWPPGPQRGTFSLRAEDRFDGWPLTTRVTRGIVALDVSFFDELTDRDDIRPPADSELGAAIIGALDVPEVSFELPRPIPTIVRRWDRTGGLPIEMTRTRYWPGTIAALSVAWLGLSIASIGGIAAGRYTWNITTQVGEVRRDRHRRRGRCAACGFDLRGNVFADRCPECGTLSE